MKHETLQRQTLDLLRHPEYRPCKFQGVLQQLGLSSGNRKQLRKLLKDLEAQGLVEKLPGNRFAASEGAPSSGKGGKASATPRRQKSREVRGVFSQHAQGFGFLAVEPDGETDKLEELFIPANASLVARHGDRVIARVLPTRKPGGPKGDDLYEGEILEVIERGSPFCVGTLRQRGNGWSLIPDDARIDGPVRITGFGDSKPKAGFKGVVLLEDRMDPGLPECGELQELLGQAGDPGVDILSIMRGHGLVSEFPPEVQAEAEAFTRAVTDKDLQERRDLRDSFIITIDPKDARDFDDALSVEEIPGKPNWLRVGVHIADVAGFVKPGGSLDQEAQARATSAYLVDRVVPMLPVHLTNDLCSLVPNQDRLAHTVMLDINTHGGVKAVDCFRSVIHSKQRLTYEQAQVFIEGGQVEGVVEGVREKVIALARLTRKLRRNRIRGNALSFDMPEIRCQLDENGDVTGFHHKKAMEAYQLVEECMLMANREVGALLAGKFGTAIYRIHEEPSEQDFENMAEQLRHLGVEGVPELNPEGINSLLSREMSDPMRQAVTLTLLKNMNRALYSAELGEHFGLAFDTYTHFTSPIRRYPDLIAHRLLLALEKDQESPYSEKDLARIAQHSSEREREAADAELESHQVKRVQYYYNLWMSGQTGPLEATVSSILPRGILVELSESGQRALLPFPALDGDYYEVNSTGTRATGRGSGRVWQMGDSLQVHLAKVDSEAKQVDVSYYAAES